MAIFLLQSWCCWIIVILIICQFDNTFVTYNKNSKHMLSGNRKLAPSAKTDLTQTIDQIMQHHYFQTKLDQMLDKKKSHVDTKSVTGLLDDQYYKAQDDLIEQLAQIVQGVVESKLRDILTQQFISIGDELQGMKQEMFSFMNEQATKTEDIKKQLFKLAEQAKRRASTTQALSSTSVVSANGYSGGIRFIRSGITSSVQSGSSSNLPSDGTNNKSFHSQLMSLKKQFDDLKANIEGGESVRLIQDQLNQFKIESKVAVEALKLQTKKSAVDIASLTKSTSSTALAPSMKEQIEASVKRTITAQLKVYGSYSQQILEIKQQIQKYDDKLTRASELHNEYLSNQLKSVWLVLNDMKKNLDDVIENIGLNSSRQILL